MTEEEAREIVERYEALLLAVVGASGLQTFACPLEVMGTELVASAADNVLTDGSWWPEVRRRPLAELTMRPSPRIASSSEVRT